MIVAWTNLRLLLTVGQKKSVAATEQLQILSKPTPVNNLLRELELFFDLLLGFAHGDNCLVRCTSSDCFGYASVEWFSFYGLHQLICSVKKRSSVSFAIHFFRRTKVSFDGSVSKRQIRISDAEEYQNPVYRDIENKDREWNITAI